MSKRYALDSEATYSTYDTEDTGYGVEHFPEQAMPAWEATRALVIPASYKACNSIVVFGMGGSQLGPHILEVACSRELKVPFSRVYGYSVPKHVGPKTLVVLSSFSGSTEEVLEAAKEAVKRKAKCVSISAGGALERFAKKHKIPHYHIEPGELAKQPRLGVGFSVVGLMGILERTGHLKASGALIHRLVSAMAEVVDSCGFDVPTKENPAKLVAEGLKDRMVLVVAAEHLEGNAHTITNQINESGKQIAFWHTLPELNHHFLEGTAFPAGDFSKFTILLVQSKLYHKRNQKRFKITADLFEEQGAEVIEYSARGKTPLEEAAEVLQFGTLFSYYLSMLNGVNPQDIPFVKRFKAEMK